jgi:hypothetical protein
LFSSSIYGISIYYIVKYQQALFLSIAFIESQYNRGVIDLLSRNCDGCSRMQLECKQRFGKACLGDKVYCPDGTAHLVDI